MVTYDELLHFVAPLRPETATAYALPHGDLPHLLSFFFTSMEVIHPLPWKLVEVRGIGMEVGGSVVEAPWKLVEVAWKLLLLPWK